MTVAVHVLMEGYVIMSCIQGRLYRIMHGSACHVAVLCAQPYLCICRVKHDLRIASRRKGLPLTVCKHICAAWECMFQ